MPTQIVVVEQHPKIQKLLPQILRHAIPAEEHRCVALSGFTEVRQYLTTHADEVAALLIEQPPSAEKRFFRFAELVEENPLLPAILILPNSNLQTIRSAMNQGAFDFLSTPFQKSDLRHTITRALRYSKQLRQNISASAQKERQFHQLQKAIETMRLGVTISNLHGTILYANPADAEMHGYAVDELAGRDIGMYAPPELRHPMTLEEIRQCQGSIRESVNIHRDGSQFPVWLISDIIKDTQDTPIAIITSCEDISERKHVEKELNKYRHHLEDLIEERTKELRLMNDDLQQEIAERQHVEEALRESEQQYRSLFENLPDVFYRIDQKGNLLLTSPSITQFLGYSLQEAMSLNVAEDLFVYSEQWDDFQMLMKTDGHLENFEVLLRRQDGSFEWGNANAQLHTDHKGSTIGFEGIIRDISIRKQAEIELMVAHDELQKTNVQLQDLNASKDKFFSIISHDLRNQFTTLLGFTEIIEARLEHAPPQRLRELFNKLKLSAEQLYALFENLLTWSRLQRGAMKPLPKHLPLFAVAEDNINMMQAKAEFKNITLQNSILKEIEVYADPGMIDTVIRNLLSNALKFTGSGGKIVISAAYEAQEVEVAIADTGHGLDQEARESLFRLDKTYTTRGTAGERGTGLGLILCQELVENNNGKIWVESELGKGTTFFFTIPTAAPE